MEFILPRLKGCILCDKIMIQKEQIIDIFDLLLYATGFKNCLYILNEIRTPRELYLEGLFRETSGIRKLD